MLYVTRDTWHVKGDRWKKVNLLSKFQLPSSYGLGVTGDMWHLTPDTCHLTYDKWHVSRDTQEGGGPCFKISSP